MVRGGGERLPPLASATATPTARCTWSEQHVCKCPSKSIVAPSQGSASGSISCLNHGLTTDSYFADLLSLPRFFVVRFVVVAFGFPELQS